MGRRLALLFREADFSTLSALYPLYPLYPLYAPLRPSKNNPESEYRGASARLAKTEQTAVYVG